MMAVGAETPSSWVGESMTITHGLTILDYFVHGHVLPETRAYGLHHGGICSGVKPYDGEHQDIDDVEENCDSIERQEGIVETWSLDALRNDDEQTHTLHCQHLEQAFPTLLKEFKG